jgi:type IV pilus assembly protein PilQ
LVIHPAVSEFTSFVADIYPRVTTTEADTQVLVESGDTVVIGGLIRQRDVKTVSRVPILGRIPLVGMLFSHTQTRKDPKNLLIFVTPRIVPVGDEAVESDASLSLAGGKLRRFPVGESSRLLRWQ